jgi:hypothetical protein
MIVRERAIKPLELEDDGAPFSAERRIRFLEF